MEVLLFMVVYKYKEGEWGIELVNLVVFFGLFIFYFMIL